MKAVVVLQKTSPDSEEHEYLCSLLGVESATADRYTAFTLSTLVYTVRQHMTTYADVISGYGSPHCADDRAYYGSRTMIPVEELLSDPEIYRSARAEALRRAAQCNKEAAAEAELSAIAERAKRVEIPSEIPIPEFKLNSRKVLMDEHPNFGIRFTCPETGRETGFFGFFSYDKTVLHKVSTVTSQSYYSSDDERNDGWYETTGKRETIYARRRGNKLYDCSDKLVAAISKLVA